jgi:4-amino-4-deoxychorismate lyase
VTLLALAVTGRGVVDPSEPVVYADDAAFLRGRAAFETTRVYGGRPFKLDAHLDRLASSAERIGLPAPDLDALRSLTADALAAADAPDAVLRLYWTPGREGANAPTGLALVSTLPSGFDELRARGIRVVGLPLGVSVELRGHAPWVLGGVKSTSYAVNIAAEAEAKRRGADDAIFLADGDIVLEGPATNVWWRSGTTLFTPSLDVGILAGVTRATVIELAGAHGFAVEEGVYPLSDLKAAEEAFTSSSIRELLPIVEVDGSPVGDGAPGSAARTLHSALRALATA